jgi:hypothetical protein
LVLASLCAMGMCLVPLRVDGAEVADWALLSQGVVVIEDVRDATGLLGIRATFAVDASREQIWTVLTNYDSYAKIFPRVQRLRVLQKDERGATLEYWGDAVVSDLHYILRRTYVRPLHAITWRRTAGDLKRIEGSWRILDGPHAELSVVVYESFVDIGIPLVGTVFRPLAKTEIRKMAVRLRAWIERTP